MHVPDGFLDTPTSLATGVVAAAAVAVSLRGARRELDERTAPLAGLVAAFVFAAQMINFPVAAGTSGHLLGGTLAAVLVGPFTATLCITVVLVVQALLFADGGLTALGTNITLMGVVGVWVGYGVFRLVLAALPRRTGSVTVAAAIGAFLSVPAAALAFAGLFAVGGTAPVEHVDPRGRHGRRARLHRHRRGAHHGSRRDRGARRAARPGVRRARRARRPGPCSPARGWPHDDTGPRRAPAGG